MGITTVAADIDAMLAHSGVSVTIGGVTSYGSLKQRNAVESGSVMDYQTRVTTLVVRTGVFTLTNGMTVVADGVNYRLDQFDLESDGNLIRCHLSRAT